MAYNPQNPNGQTTMANSAPVVVASDQLLSVHLTQEDTFEQILTSSRYSQLEVDFSTTAPGSITTLTVTNTSGGSSSNSDGQAVFTSGTNTSGGVKAVTTSNVTYRPHSESYVAFSIIFPSGGLANSHQRIGLYDTNNGFFIGYEGTSFGLTIRKGGSDTRVPQASWNMDTLTGAANSKYTSGGVPVIYNPTKDNLFRIRFGWLGAANVTFDIYSPDGTWLPFHIYRPANVVPSPSINNPNLPVTLDIQKTAAGATSLTMNTACWSAGSTSEHDKVTATITDNSLASLTRSIIVGETSGGGGGYKNVKVTPSGALTVEATVTATNLDIRDLTFATDKVDASGSTLGANSGVDIGDVTINNAAGASAVNIQDGGNSITVDGTVTANAGTGTFAISATSLPLPSGAATSAKQPALGTAGTASADVISVQGISGMTALKVDGSGVTQPVSSSASISGGVTWSGPTNTLAGSPTTVLIKNGPGQIYGWYFYNPNSAAAYIFFYDALTATVPNNADYYIVIPPVSGANVFGLGIQHNTGIRIGASTAKNLSGPFASPVDYTIFYK